MAAQKGSDIIIRIEDPTQGSPVIYVAIAGLRTKSFTLNSEQVDITNADSLNKWRELLPGAGIKSLSASGAGVFLDSAVDQTMANEFFNQAHLEWQLEFPSFAIFQGRFQVTQLQYAGEHNGEATWDISIESAGEINMGLI